jgi:putative salt-induced outer membrane protein YdiY
MPPPAPTIRNISPPPPAEPRLLALVRGRTIPREALARKPVVVPLSAALPTSLSTVGWKRRINLTYALARGNANTADLGFVGSVTRRAARSQATLTATRRFGRNNGNVAADFSQATFRYDLALGPTNAAAAMRPSYFSESTWERDPMAKLEQRLIENTGLSIPLSPDPASNLALEVGIGITHTAFTDEKARTHMGALIRLAAKQKFGSANTDQQVSSYPDLVGPTLHYRFDTNFNLAAPLNKTVALKIGFINRYDTKPQPGVKRNDAIVQSGLGIEF